MLLVHVEHRPVPARVPPPVHLVELVVPILEQKQVRKPQLGIVLHVDEPVVAPHKFAPLRRPLRRKLAEEHHNGGVRQCALEKAQKSPVLEQIDRPIDRSGVVLVLEAAVQHCQAYVLPVALHQLHERVWRYHSEVTALARRDTERLVLERAVALAAPIEVEVRARQVAGRPERANALALMLKHATRMVCELQPLNRLNAFCQF